MSSAGVPDESMPADVEAVVKLAVQLGYGRGGVRGCAIPFEELRRLRETLSEEQLHELVERQRQLDEAHVSQQLMVDRQPARPRRWFARLLRANR